MVAIAIAPEDFSIFDNRGLISSNPTRVASHDLEDDFALAFNQGSA